MKRTRSRLGLILLVLVAGALLASPAVAQPGIPRAWGDGTTENPDNIRIQWRDMALGGGSTLAELHITYEGPLAHQYDNCLAHIGLRRAGDAKGWQDVEDYGMHRVHDGIFYLSIPLVTDGSGRGEIRAVQLAFKSLVADGTGAASEVWDNGGGNPLAYYECDYLREEVRVVEPFPPEESPRNVEMSVNSYFTGGHTVGGTLFVTYRGGLAAKYAIVSIRFGVQYYFDDECWQDVCQVDLAKTGLDTFEGEIPIIANHGFRGRLTGIQFVFCSPYGPMGQASWDNGGTGPMSYYGYDVSSGRIRIVEQ